MSRLIPISFLVMIAGCTTGTPVATPDTGVPTDGGSTDSGPPPADMAKVMPDMAQVAIKGTKVSSGALNIYGTTNDNYVIVIDTAKKALEGISTTGTVKTISMSQTISFRPLPGGLLTWDSLDAMTGVGGSPSVWTATNGLVQLGTTGLDSADVSADGAWVYFSDNAASDGTASDFIVAKTDGTGAHTFLTQANVIAAVDHAHPGCPRAQWIPGGKLVMMTCDSTGLKGAGVDGGGNADGGVAPAAGLVIVVDAATGNVTKLKSNVYPQVPFSVDAAGAKVFVADSTHKGAVVSTGGSPEVSIDSDVQEGYLVPDGSSVVYLNSTGSLKRAGTGVSPMPTTLVATNANNILEYRVGTGANKPCISPDGKWVIIANALDGMTGLGDLEMASTVTPGAAISIVADTKGTIFGNPFSSDSSHLLYFTTVVSVGAGLIGKFQVAPMPAGSPATQVAKSSWVEYTGASAWVSYDDAYKTGKGSLNGRGDIYVLNATGGMPILLAQQADADFYPTQDGTKLAFVTNSGAASVNGLYIYTFGM